MSTDPRELDASDGLEAIEDSDLYLELPLRRACIYSEDAGTTWIEALPEVLANYPQITPDAYWNLTVAEAAALLLDLEPDPEAEESEES